MVLKFTIFENSPGLVYGLSEKADGGMSRAADFQSNRAGNENRQKFLAKHQIDTVCVKMAGLAHSSDVFKVNGNEGQQIIPDVDGLVTDTKNLYLSITTADCFPVYIFDPKRQAIGLIHAGWRGITAGIVKNALAEMRNSFKSAAEDLKIGIGPGIHVCHFEIKADILPEFKLYPQQAIKRNNKIFVDLPAIIRQQLLEFGLKSGNIETSEVCTYCQPDKYFSYRRDNLLTPMLAFIGIK